MEANVNDGRAQKVISRRLNALMKERGISQNKLARLVGVTQPMICEYVHGRHAPSVCVLIHIAHALRVTLDELVGMSEIFNGE